MWWMRFYSLLLLAGIIRAEHVLQVGRESIYNYNTTVASGLLRGGSEFSVITIEAKLRVSAQVPDQLVFMLEEVKVGELNEELPDLNLRTLQVPTERHNGYEQLLKLPFSAEYNNGKVVKTRFQRSDMIWSKDLKKGVISMFQLPKHEKRSEDPFKDVQGKHGAITWTSIEPSVLGIWEVHTTEESIPYPGNPNAKVLNVTRRVNTENANKTAKFILSNHPPIMCTQCNNDKDFPMTHNVITKLNIEVHEQKYVIPEIYREGTVKFSPMGARGDAIYSIYNQWLVLKESRAARSTPKISDVVEGLISNLKAEMQIAYTPSLKPPAPHINSNISAAVQNLLNEIAEVTLNQEDFEKIKKILSLQILIQKALSNLPEKSIRRIIQDTLQPKSEKEKIRMKAALDMLVRTGTKDANFVALKLIEEKQITDEERIIAMLQNIATHTLIPDLATAHQISELCPKFDDPKYTVGVRKSCIFSFSELVGRACTDYDHVPPTTKCLEDKGKAFLTHMNQRLEAHKQTGDEELAAAFIAGIGLMQLKSGITSLTPIALGHTTSSTILRRTAIYALSQLAKKYPEEIREIMFMIFYDSKENAENRIAALAVVLASGPPESVYDDLAAYTWNVKDQQVGAYIISSLQGIANNTVPCLKKIANYAKHSLQVANKDMANGIHMGYRTVVNSLISYMEVATVGHFHYFGEGGGLLPSEWHLKLQDYAAGFFNNLLEFGGAARGLTDVFDKLWGPGYMHREETFMDILNKININIPDQGRDYINQKLGIKPRTNEGQAALLMTLRVLYHKYSQFYINGTEAMRLITLGLMSGDSVKKSFTFDLIRYLMPLDVKYVIPSAAGHHLHLDVKIPMMAGVRGIYSISASLDRDGKAALAGKFIAKPILAGKLNVKFGPVLPCRQKSSKCEESTGRVPGRPTWGVHYAGGFETTIILKPKLSVAIDTHFDHGAKKIVLALGSDSSGPNEASVYYKSKPFTSIYPRSSLYYLNAYSKTMYILDKPYKVDRHIQIARHLDFVMKGQHEDEWLDQADIISSVQKRGLVGMLNFPFLTQRLRFREFIAQLQHKSDSPQYMVELNWDYTPAKSDPNPRPRNARQYLWSIASEWFNLPENCFYQPKPRERAFFDKGYGSEYDSPQTSTYSPWTSSSTEGSAEESVWHRSFSEERFHSRESFSEERFGLRGLDDRASKVVPFGEGSSLLQLNGHFGVKGQGTAYIFNSTMKSERNTLIRRLEATLIKRGNEGFATSLKLSYQYKELSCYMPLVSSSIIQNVLPNTAEMEMKWGPSKESMSNAILVSGIAYQTMGRNYREGLSSKSKDMPWYITKCREEERKGFYNAGACQKVLDYVNKLRRFVVDIDYTKAKFSDGYQKAFVNAGKLVSSWLAIYLREDLYDVSQKGKAKVVVKFNDTMPVLDLEVKTPQGKMFYQDIYFGEALPSISSPSKRKSMLQIVLDYATSYQAPPVCLTSGSHLRTFNNATLNLNGVGTCPYLLTKDCSSGNIFYVLLKHNERSKDYIKTLYVGALKHNITIIPREAEGRDIYVDGKPNAVNNKSIVYLRDPSISNDLYAIILKVKPYYRIILPYLGVRVTFNGDSAEVEASNLWRKKLCGLCGEFQGRTQYNRIGPDQCAYPNDEDLVSQYVLREDGCSTIPKSKTKLCGLNSSPAVPASLRYHCQIERHYKAHRDNQVCFTIDTYHKCTDACQAGNFERRSVPAICLRREHEMVPKLEQEIEQGAVPYLQDERPNSQMVLFYPKSCTHK